MCECGNYCKFRAFAKCFLWSLKLGVHNKVANNDVTTRAQFANFICVGVFYCQHADKSNFQVSNHL